MSRWFKIFVVLLAWLIYTKSIVLTLSDIIKTNDLDTDVNENFYKNIIEDIRKDRSFDSILITYGVHPNCARIQAIHELNIPKMLLTHPQIINYQENFNSEILAVIIIEENFMEADLRSLVLSLNNMHQTRIFVIALNMKNPGSFKELILKSCEKHKIANVIIYFSTMGQPFEMSYYLMKPYPNYHLELLEMNSKSRPYFKQHWRNMHNITLLTLPDQYGHSSLVYNDGHINGVATRFVLLFGEKYNATIKLAYDVRPNDVIHFTNFINLTQQRVVDIPMSFHPMVNAENFRRFTYPLIYGRYMMMFPRPQQMPIKEVYKLLVSMDIFVCILVAVVAFSVIHSTIDYVFDGQFHVSNVLMSDKVIPGVLGQSFVEKQSSLKALKFIYLLIIFIGLNLTTIFGANFNTLITSPPFYRRIKTFADISRSNVKVLLDPVDVHYFLPHILRSFADNIVYSPSTNYFQTTRKSFDMSYGYTVGTPLWSLFAEQLSFFGQDMFYSAPGATICDVFNDGLIVEENSLLKEPLNNLIHLVNNAELRQAWRTSTVQDMIRYKTVTKSRTMPAPEHHALTVDDLWWTWIILLFGLALGFLVWLMDILYMKKEKLRRVFREFKFWK